MTYNRMGKREIIGGLRLSILLTLFFCYAAYGADGITINTMAKTDALGTQSVPVKEGKLDHFCEYWQTKADNHPRVWKSIKFGGKVVLYGVQLGGAWAQMMGRRII